MQENEALADLEVVGSKWEQGEHCREMDQAGHVHGDMKNIICSMNQSLTLRIQAVREQPIFFLPIAVSEHYALYTSLGSHRTNFSKILPSVDTCKKK